MRSRILAVLCCGTIALTGGVVTAPAALADSVGPKVVSVTISPKTPITYKTGRTKTQIDVRLQDADGINSKDVDVTLVAASNKDFEWPQMSRVSGTAFDGVWRGYVNFDNYSSPGKWYVDVSAWDRAWNYTQKESVKTFYVKRDIRISANAAPEPVKKGSPLTVTGNLKKLTTYDGYRNWKDTKVRIEFRPAGKSTWTHLATATTDRSGNYKKRFTATKSGSWRARFVGTSTVRTKASAADYVAVR